MRQVGKRGKLWAKTRKEWIKENPPNFDNYYTCYLCGKWVEASSITLDHVISRSRRPDLLTDFDNLKPCCYLCNSNKGSKIL